MMILLTSRTYLEFTGRLLDRAFERGRAFIRRFIECTFSGVSYKQQVERAVCERTRAW